MPLRKTGTPEPIQPDQEGVQKRASQEFTEKDREELRKENAADTAPTEE